MDTLDLADAITANDVVKAKKVVYKGVTLYEIMQVMYRKQKRYNLIVKSPYVPVGLTNVNRGEVAKFLRWVNTDTIDSWMERYSEAEMKKINKKAGV